MPVATIIAVVTSNRFLKLLSCGLYLNNSVLFCPGSSCRPICSGWSSGTAPASSSRGTDRPTAPWVQPDRRAQNSDKSRLDKLDLDKVTFWICAVLTLEKSHIYVFPKGLYDHKKPFLFVLLMCPVEFGPIRQWRSSFAVIACLTNTKMNKHCLQTAYYVLSADL